MPINNLGRLHLTAAQKTSFSDAITIAEEIMLSVTQNLTSEERQRFGSVNENNKLVVNKSRDYYQTQPALSSPDVDWIEFEADFQDRVFSDTNQQRLLSLLRMLTDFKIVHDYDNYQDALTDYDYSKYKAGTKTPGFSEKVADIKTLFPNSGGSGTPPEPNV